MSEPVLTTEQLMKWVERTSTGWRDLIDQHPEILTMPCDIMGVSTAGGLLQHIVAVELRYAERLSGMAASDYTQVPYDSAAALYATHERAFALLRALLASNVDWEEPIEFMTRSRGLVRSKRHTILFHGLLHSIRHYAQLATLVRQHGVAPGWPMDYLFMDVEPA